MRVEVEAMVEEEAMFVVEALKAKTEGEPPCQHQYLPHGWWEQHFSHTSSCEQIV